MHNGGVERESSHRDSALLEVLPGYPNPAAACRLASNNCKQLFCSPVSPQHPWGQPCKGHQHTECHQGGAKTALPELRDLQENQLHLGNNLCPSSSPHSEELNPLLRAGVAQDQWPKVLQKWSPLATTSVLCLCCCFSVVQPSHSPRDAPCMCWSQFVLSWVENGISHWEQQHCSPVVIPAVFQWHSSAVPDPITAQLP